MLKTFEKHPFWLGGLLLVVIVAFAFLCHWAQSYFEAAAYNRATGSNVSTWDAMWIELRVQAGPK